jgi:hypothetical protein
MSLQISTTSGNLMQLCATWDEQRHADKGKLRASSLIKLNLSKCVMHSVKNEAEFINYNYPSIFKTTDNRVYTFGTEFNSREWMASILNICNSISMIPNLLILN